VEPTVIERYLVLGLRLGRHVDGYVDAYYGPEELKDQVDAEELVPPAELAAEAAALRGELDAIDDPQRRRWLEAQLHGAETAARRLAGEEIDFVDEVERCYGIRPAPTPEREFEEALRVLDDALPGDGDLGSRFQAWRDSHTIPREQLAPAIDVLKTALRERTAALVDLPDGEAVESELVSNEPWLGFNYYLGGLHSRSVINTDLPIRSYTLPDYVAHEMYPGHHTEHAVKEARLVRGRGQLEESLFLVPTPQSLLAEGIATNALEIVLDEDADDWGASVLEPLGVAYDAEQARALRKASRTLGFVSANSALQVHRDGLPLDEVRAYYTRWTLADDTQVEKHIEFVTDPTWRSYVFNYSSGERLVRDWVDGDRARFRRLLTEQVTPADLRA
jgi:hypothetical protein